MLLRTPDVTPEHPTVSAALPDGRVLCFFGDRKTGKSYLARKMALASVTVNGSYASRAIAVYVTPNGSVTDPWPGPTLAECPRLESAPRVFAMRGGKAYEQAAAWALEASSRRRIVLVVDEAQRVWRENFGDGSAMGELFHEGRHRGVDLYVITQWPVRVDKRLVYAADETRWFRLHEPGNLEWLRRRYSYEAASEVAGLPDRTWITVLADEPPPQWRWAGERKVRRNEPLPQDPRSRGRGGRGLPPAARQDRRGDPPPLGDTEDTEET